MQHIKEQAVTIAKRRLSRAVGTISAAALVAASIALAAQPASAATTVHNWQTSAGGDRLTAKSDLTFATDSSAPDILVDPTQQYQAIDGFGGAFNEAGWTVLNRSNVTATQRNAVLDQLFNPATGAGFSLTRTAMGSNDFSTTPYTYDDIPTNTTDYAQSNFSAAHDETSLIPYIQAAQSHGAFRIMASPWTAPAWMKQNKSLDLGTHLVDDPNVYAAYALYFEKYVQAYAAHGITINDVSIQNEPLNKAAFESTQFTPQEMGKFIAANLGPKFAADNISTRIRGYEHNRDSWDFPRDMLNVPDTTEYTAGIDFHPYECDFGQKYCDTANLGLFNQAKPGYSTWMSEHTDLGVPDASDYAGDERWGSEVVDEMQAGEGGYIYWNMVLDQTGGPFEALSDAQEPLVIVDTSGATASVKYMPKFYELAQFSKFVRPGAYRIGTSGGANSDGMKSVAFKNTDGTEALVVVNTTNAAKTVKVGEAGSTFSRSVAAHSTNTFTWSAPVNTYHVIAGASSTATSGATNGDHYTGDAQFTGGGTAVNAHAITGTADDALYQPERNGTNFSYAFSVPTGRYRVGLKMSENYHTAVGQRVFNVTAEGATELSNFDIFAAAGGQYKALDKSFDVTVTDGTLNLGFASTVDLAKVDAISVTPIVGSGAQYASTVSAGVPAGFSTGSGSIPGFVFGQDYNAGGEGIGYHFSGSGGTDTAYRADATHLQACTGDTYCGDNVGWLANGDWLNYTSTVNVSGDYDVHVKVASGSAGGTFSIDLDGRPWIGSEAVPNTGGLQTWQAVNIDSVNLPLGKHTFTVRVGTGGFNLHSIEFSKIFQLSTTAPNPIEAEWYGTGGEGFGSHDATAGNSFTAPLAGYVRGGDTDVEISSSGNFDVGNTENGEWMKYVVYNPTAKTYNVGLRAASGFSSGQVRYDLDSIGNTVGATTSIPNTSDTSTTPITLGWQIFTTVNTSVTIPAGYHALYVYVVTGGFNIDSLTLS
jgi:O-glycosyl hydrolase